MFFCEGKMVFLFKIMKQETIPDIYILSWKRIYTLYFPKYTIAVRHSGSLLLRVRICVLISSEDNTPQ